MTEKDHVVRSKLVQMLCLCACGWGDDDCHVYSRVSAWLEVGAHSRGLGWQVVAVFEFPRVRIVPSVWSSIGELRERSAETAPIQR